MGISKAESIIPNPNQVRREGIASQLFVPLRVRRKALGVLGWIIRTRVIASTESRSRWSVVRFSFSSIFR